MIEVLRLGGPRHPAARHPGAGLGGVAFGRYLARRLSAGVVCWLSSLSVLWWGGAAGVHALQCPPSPPVEVPVHPPPRDHAWLARPVRGGRPGRFYPYGSTGQGQYQVHHGVEFPASLGTPVVAVADGTVVVSGSDESRVWGRHPGYYGLLVVVRLTRRYGNAPVYVLYGHLSRVSVRAGQRVRDGEVLGKVGSTGVALGPHLHFEVRVGHNTFSDTRNPELWFTPLPGHGTIIGRITDFYGWPLPEVLATFHPVEQPNRYWREAWTYPDIHREQIHPDDVWRENMVMGDVPAGAYIIAARIDGKLYTRRVAVEEGEVALVTFRSYPVEQTLDVRKIRP